MPPRSVGPRLRPTLAHRRAREYRRAQGPWDREGLDGSFRRGAKALVVDGSSPVDAHTVEGHVAALAGSLRALGVRRGDVVAWQLPNGVRALVLYRACWRIGAVAAPVHHRMGTAEVRSALAQVNPLVVLSCTSMPAADHAGAITLDTGSDPRAFGSVLPEGKAVPVSASVARGTDLAVALFTSGSTGVPKAVLHTHRGLGYKASLMIGVHGLSGDDAVLMPAPLAHISGLLNGVLIPSLAGIPSVLMAAWDPDEALGLVEEHRVSFMGAPPVFFSQMASVPRFSAERVRSMQLISTGGASVSPAFVDEISEAFGCRVKRTYGSTEAPTVTTSMHDDDARHARDTDGRALGELELEIRDPATTSRLPPGAPGEIWLRGPELFVGYSDPEATRAVIGRPGAWYRSGDLGVLDDEGWLKVVGRLSDIVIRAGENISASEVEAVLESHPAVRHAVAVGFPDVALGERLAAFVESTEPFDLEACREWFALKGITRFKTPEVVVRLDRLPVLAAGKADRAALRKMALELASSQRPCG